MKKLSMMLGMVFFTIQAFSQFQIQGIVMNAADGTILPGANVVINGTGIGTSAKSDGRFVLSVSALTKAELVVSYVGFETARVDVSQDNYSDILIWLQPWQILTQEVIVRATRADDRTPVVRTDISSEFIRANNLGQDLPFLLELTPGLVTSSDAGAGIGYTWMNIRGSDHTRINVTINGIPINDAESHGVWWVNMPDLASSTDNIQIQRGVGTSTQGAAAFGATISIETTQLQDKPYGEVISTAGSFNTFRNTVNFGTGLMDNQWSFDGRLSRISSDGYIDRSFSELASFYLSGGYFGRNTTLKAVAFSGREQTYQAWYGVPSAMLQTDRTYNPAGKITDSEGNIRFYENETDNYQQDHYQLHMSQRLGNLWLFNASLHYTYGRGYYEQYRQNERFSNYGLPSVVIDNQVFDRTDLIRQRWLDNHFYGVTYSVNYNESGNLNGIFGGGYNIYDGDHFGEIIWAQLSKNFDKGYRYYDNHAQKRDFNSFLKLNYELLDGLYVFGDLQYRNIIYNFQGPSMVNNEIIHLDQQAQFNFWNPKAGLVFDIDARNNTYLFAGISNREPVRRDFTQSSPESRPRHETLRNIELGYRFRDKNFNAGVNFYLMDYKDQLILTGEINDVGGFTRTNIENSYRAGVELESAWSINKMLRVEGNLSLSQSKIPEFTEYSDVYDDDWNWVGVDERTYTNTDIAFSPSVVGAALISFMPLPDATIRLSGKYVSKQYIDNTMSEARKLDAYFVNDLKLSYVFRNSLFRELEITFAINNLFGVDYITNAWIYKGVVGNSGLISIEDGFFPQAGRHFLGGVRLRL